MIQMKNNNQKILRLLAKREYQENKRRNRILIGTVAFAVWMIFCVFSLAIGKVQADYLLMVRNGGTKASTTLENPSEEQYRKIQKLAYIRSAGMETDFAATDAFLCTVLDKIAWEKMLKPAYTDIHGEYPTEEDEIMLPMRALKLLGISKPKIGMTIPVTMTDSEGEERSGDFRLSGYYTEYVDPSMGKAYGYFSQKYLDQLNLAEVSRTLLIEQSRSVDGQTVEDRLYQDIPMRDDSQQFFGGTGLGLEAVTELVGGYDIAAVMAVVILLAAWLLIYNVLHISYGKDIRRFGLLKTLGTTGKQIRSIAYRQIRKIAVLGCLWGSVAGVAVTLTVIPALLSRMYLHGLGKASAMIAFRPWMLAASVCFGMLVTFLGAAGVVRKIGKLSPVESIQYMEKVSAGRKSRRQSKDPLKAMAWRNLFRFRKRCVLTIVSLTLGICVALSAVVITNGTDMTNQIEAENHDFKIMTNISSGTISQYPTEETYFPEELIDKMTGLDGVETVAKVTGGYGKLQLDEKILDLRRKTLEENQIPEENTENIEETAPKFYEFVAELVSDDYLEELKTLNEEKNLGLDLESVEAGTGAIMLHYNLFSRIEAEKGREDVGETFSTYTVQGEKTADMKFCGHLNFKEKGLPALDTTWNGPGIVYFLVGEKGMERMRLPVQTFVLEMDVNRSMEPMIRESVEKSVDSYNMQFVTGSSHGDYISDARTLMLVCKSELLFAARSYIASSRIIMYGLCLVLLFMGLMNYFHVIVTGYTVRQKEFSMMQSIGMTTRQLKNMTRMEGIFYGLIVGVLVLTVGSGVLGVVAVVMKSRVGYFRFVYPWRELIGVLLILGGLCVAIPEGVFRRMRKNREIERGF